MITQSNSEEDEPLDALSQLIANCLAKNPKETERSQSKDLVQQLPEPYPHDNDGFSHSFSVDEAEEINAFFDKYGYVVVRDVLNESEIQDSRDEFFAKFNVDDECSVTEYLNRYENQLSRLGIIGINNDIQSPTLLGNRQNERVYQAFAAVYDETELFVDHDRIGAMRPTLQSDGTIKKEWQTINNWLHLDCNPVTGEISIASMAPPKGGHHDFDKGAPFLVQGFLALSDAREQDGGFLCVPGSHRIAKEWAIRNGWDKRSFPGQLKPDRHDLLWQHTRCIPVRAGSLVIWNQFTFHANHPNRSDRWRLNQYVRMYPYAKTRFRPIAVHPDDYPGDFVENAITPLGRRLFGIDPWNGEESQA